MAAHQTSLSFTISRSLLKFKSNKSVMPSSHLILCHPLLLLPSVFPSIKIMSNEKEKCPLLYLWNKDKWIRLLLDPSNQSEGHSSPNPPNFPRRRTKLEHNLFSSWHSDKSHLERVGREFPDNISLNMTLKYYD